MNIYEWASSVAGHSISGVPLYVVFVSGCLGLLGDIDHPIAYYWLHINQRFLHPYMLIVGGTLFCLAITLGGGLLLKTFLGGGK